LSFFLVLSFSGVNSFQVLVQSIEALHPELAVAFDPLVHLDEWIDTESARPPLGIAAASNQASPLQDVQMLRHCRAADVEWACQLVDGDLAVAKPRQHLPPDGVSKGRERSIKVLHYYTIRLINYIGNYKVQSEQK
jgi:hypothetical protein